MCKVNNAPRPYDPAARQRAQSHAPDGLVQHRVRGRAIGPHHQTRDTQRLPHDSRDDIELSERETARKCAQRT
eukprot:scaffold99868_cov30-Tisochrysis_lutea.AAC.1